MNEIFMNSSFIKDLSLKKEIISHLNTIIFFINNYNEKKEEKIINSIQINIIYISLSFLTLLETKIKNIPAYILESLLIDNSKIVILFKNIYIYIYKRNIQIDNFQIPTLKNFVNFTFKY